MILQTVNMPYILNTYCGSILLLIIIFADCYSKLSGDILIRRFFCALLTITFLSLTADLILTLFNIISPDLMVLNKFTDGVLFITPLFFALCCVLLIRKTGKTSNFPAFCFLILYIISSGFNVISGSPKFFWSVITALMIFIYLFIILHETKIDNLTGLNNRYSFFEYAGKFSRNNSGESWIVLMIDVSNFKSINNIYGQLEGDSVLCVLAGIIDKCADKIYFTARYGGDEFILTARADNDADVLINKIAAELQNYNENGGKLYNIDVEYRYDTFTADGKTQLDVFLYNIDKQLKKEYEEKRRAGDFTA